MAKCRALPQAQGAAPARVPFLAFPPAAFCRLPYPTKTGILGSEVTIEQAQRFRS
jgi:hypothetical protein